ncbi:peptide chain release factor N(5)-glutamine methyltransferase [Corynebacterium sphenisci]|uniref:peptide chain release factor N(5)-glutamine methyltransferase n=1 Tax=Corynebacterium sphenisci TaxID=191493 RepID=UPI0026DF731E|nr:peptide chain release factor N(5)-glutamine methyltransferase [Corynebacterium sphenisci]MDO5731049.1 peptide chain release factor N(5)-glutamine methyltransferase [Corynebacterium sphenisci]
MADPALHELLAAAEAELAAAGCAAPAAEALQLACHAAGRDRTALLLARRDPVRPGSPLRTRLPGLIARRARREPLQHILGTAALLDVELAVGPGVFIPRPETECLVDRYLRENTLREPIVVDLCTGTGAIALAVAAALPGARVHAVERSPEALAWARRNIDAAAADRPGLRIAERVTLLPGDAADPGLLPGLRGRVDAVLSNPPYVPEGSAVDAETRADPPEAVFAGPDGLALIRPMAPVIAGLLRPGGYLALEHDGHQHPAVAGILAGAGFTGIAARRDLVGRERFTTAVRAGAAGG